MLRPPTLARNSEAYYQTLGPEIWEQTQGTVTHFVAGGSTGGTITGVGRYLKEQSPDVRVIMADPVGSVFKEAPLRVRIRPSP